MPIGSEVSPHPFPRRARRCPRLVALAAAVLLVWDLEGASADTCASPAFVGPTQVNVQGSPYGIVFGDWNRDGDIDMAVTNSGSGSVSIRLGNGAGAFPITSDVIGLGNTPEGLSSGDFDGDPFPDLAVAVRGANKVQFLRGSAGGTFTLLGMPFEITGVSQARAVAAADFNRDGLTDVAVAAYNADRVMFFVRTGAFTFSPTSTILTDKLPMSLAVGDYDRDGDLDVASASEADSSVSILLNNGSGIFTELGSPTPIRYGVGSFPHAITAADLDLDGRLDLVTADFNGDTLSILRNAGAGTFTPVGTLGAGDGPSSVAAADFDRDGTLDLVSTARTDDAVYVHLGRGGFVFDPAVSVPLGPTSGPLGVATGDLDSDGKADVAAVRSFAAQVAILLNDTGFPCANQSFTGAPRSFPASTGPFWLVKGDFNGDGRLDVAVGNDLSGIPDQVGVLLGTGTTGFGPVAGFTTGPGTSQPAMLDTADFDGDGRLDLVTPNNTSGNISVLPGAPGGTFLAPFVIPVGGGPVSATTGDFNGDGQPDIAVSNNAGNSVSVLLHIGGFTFTAPANYVTSAAPGQVAAGDVNNDGNVDLVVALGAPTNKVGVLLGNGNGIFGVAANWPAAPLSGIDPVSLVLADFNADGKLDVATANRTSNSISVLTGTGTGSFTETQNRPVGGDPQTITAGDFNGDGRLDLATANTTAGSVSVFLGSGGAFGPATTFSAVSPPIGIVAGDFTGDGQVDLATTSPGASAVHLFVGKGNGTFVVNTVLPAATGPAGTEVADFNRDGNPDFVTAHSSGMLSAFLGNGTGGFAATPTALAGNLRHAMPGDFDRDGIPDLAVAGNTPNQVRLMKGNGAGGFSPLGGVASAPSNPTQLAVGDFDRDGDLDVVAALGSSEVVAYRYNAGGIGTGPFSTTVIAAPATGIVAGDFDKDGLLDLAVALQSLASVSVLKGDGLLGFVVLGTAPLPAGAGPRHLVAADFDDDGDLDLATANDGLSTVSFLRNNGLGVFVNAGNFATGVRPAWIVAGDFNADGLLDVATANITGSSVSALSGNGSGSFAAPATWGVNGAAFSLATADFDRDGKPDFVATGSISNSVSVILNSNCAARRFLVVQQPSSCNMAGTPFAPQPRLGLFDDGANPIRCDGNVVTAALVAGTGGAILNGTKVIPTTAGPTGGSANYTNLSIDRNGVGFELGFTHQSTSVIPARTREFTVGLSVDINGPATLCANVTSAWNAVPPAFVVPPAYDRYSWFLDSTPVPGNFNLVLGPLAPSNYVLRLDATLDSCTVTKTTPFTAEPPLATVTINFAGSQIEMCTTCSGPLVSVTEGGGGPIVGRQWGFRTVSGTGAITNISGATGPTYTIFGPHFPGPGVYYLVETSTPTCGVPVVSNELEVTLFGTTAGAGLPVFTATSKDKENTLEWLNPASTYFGTLIRFNESTSGTSDCTFPTGPGDGTELTFQAGVAGDRDSKLHGTLTNDTTYCYMAFVATAPHVYVVPGKELKARPFDNSGDVKWAFSTGAAALSAPGMGQGVIHVVANDGSVHSVLKGASGGTWAPLPWKPPVLPLPSQTGRPSAVPVTVAGANPVLFLSSQDGHVYTFSATSGAPLWSPAAALGDNVQAGPSGVFTAFSGSRDLILVGTHNSSSPNSFFGLRLSDGGASTPGWVYSGGGGDGQIGIISGQAAVDYVAKRVYFASRAYGASLNTVWCVDFETGLAVWAKPHGNISTGVTLREDRLYVGLDSGGVIAIDTADGNATWTFATPLAVKGFVYADRLTDDLYFSTAAAVYSISDDGAGWTDKWGTVAMTNPSTPVFIPNDDKVYVGGVGSLLRLKQLTGSGLDAFPLGDGSATVGSPTIDLMGGFVYVGTESGTVYAIRLVP